MRLDGLKRELRRRNKMVSKKKACSKCRLLISGNECPICKTSELNSTWKGKLIIFDASKSELAKKAGITSVGEYAIKTR